MERFIRIITYGTMAAFAFFLIFMSVLDYKQINDFVFVMLFFIFINAYGFVKLMFKKNND